MHPRPPVDDDEGIKVVEPDYDRHCRISRQMAPVDQLIIRKFVMLKMDFADGGAGVKTDVCPGVSGFCPALTGILSRFVRFFVPMWPGIRRDTWRTGSRQTGETLLKIDGDSGGAVSVVPQIQCTYHRSRARARWGQTYASARGNQGESVQVGVGEIQWGA